jgi:hypothetical protein
VLSETIWTATHPPASVTVNVAATNVGIAYRANREPLPRDRTGRPSRALRDARSRWNVCWTWQA